MHLEVKNVVLEVLRQVKAQAIILEVMDISDEYFDQIIKKIESEKTEEENDMDLDPRVYMQTDEWVQRFKALSKQSPPSEWEWLIGYYNGDQDVLDYLFNEYKRKEMYIHQSGRKEN